MRISELPHLPEDAQSSSGSVGLGISKPFLRTVRQLTDGSYRGNGNGFYVTHLKYAKDPWHDKRAFQILDKEIDELFSFVEPSKQNLGTFSHKILGLLTKICFEVEANRKAILTENEYVRSSKYWSMNDYCKVEKSHFLSGYKVKLAVWHGDEWQLSPFSIWKNSTVSKSPKWYQSYHSAKHNRHGEFASSATFENLLEAYCALSILIWSQFFDADGPGPSTLTLGTNGGQDGFAFGPMNRTLIMPANLPVNERYSFNWNVLKDTEQPFDKFSY